MNRTGILVANGALVVLCCFLAAQIVASLAAEVLAPPPVEGALVSRPAEPARPRGNDPQVILERNLFEVSTLGATAPVDEEEVYAKTKLPLRLLGTAAVADPELSWAAVQDLDTREHLVVRVDDELQGKAQVVRIDRGRIVLQNGPRLEELSLEEETGSEPPVRSARARDLRGRRGPADTRGRSLTSNIRRLGENRFSVPRADVESATKNPAALFSQARILPKYQDGEMVGVQLNSIQSGSLFEQIGIRNGDTITEFNGIRVTGQQQSAEVLRELTEATEFDVSVTGEDGGTRRLRYELR